jgi:hypothetical protein
MDKPTLLEYANALAPEHPEDTHFPEIQKARPRVSWDHIIGWLREVHGIKIARSTLTRRFEAWERGELDAVS